MTMTPEELKQKARMQVLQKVEEWFANSTPGDYSGPEDMALGCLEDLADSLVADVEEG